MPPQDRIRSPELPADCRGFQRSSGGFRLALLVPPAGVLVRTLPGAVHAVRTCRPVAFLPRTRLRSDKDARARAADRRIARGLPGDRRCRQDDFDDFRHGSRSCLKQGTKAGTMGVPAFVHFRREDRGGEMTIAMPLVVVFPATLQRGTSSDWGKKNTGEDSRGNLLRTHGKCPSARGSADGTATEGRGIPRVVSGDLMRACHTQMTGSRRALRSSRLMYQWSTSLEMETLDAYQPVALTAHDRIGSSLAT